MQEKMNSLSKYQMELKNKLASEVVPKKHKNRPKEYVQFLKNELEAVTKKIEAMKLASSK